VNIVTEYQLDTAKLFEELRKRGAGSVIFHYAVVKNKAGDQSSSGICFERMGDMESELTDIETDVRQRWNINDILLVRRLGRLNVGDLISMVAVSAGASRDAFEACQYALDRTRKMTCLKKTELFLD